VSAAGLDLLNRLLTYDPARRLTARAAARHPYLASEAPLPRRPADMPTFPSAHDLDARGWHARRRAQCFLHRTSHAGSRFRSATSSRRCCGQCS
jgi:serine/threonine protein kinase